MDATGSACVIILNLPPSSFCGIDLLSFTTSARFKGIKHIPSGFHFLFTGAESTFSLRHGIWFYVPEPNESAPTVLIFKWNPTTEELDAEKDEASILGWRANLGSIWRDELTPYRQSAPVPGGSEEIAEETNDWPKLTDAITISLISKITQQPKVAEVWSITSSSSARQDADDIPGLTRQEADGAIDKELQFLPIDLKNTWRKGAIGRERTEAAQDRSWALENLVREACEHDTDIIGELQAVFIMVLTINNNSCLEQWRRILGLVLTCQTAAVEHAAFFVRFLETLKLQLEHCSDAENGLFDFSDAGATLLKSLMKRFRRGLEQQPGSQGKIDVMDQLDELEDFLRMEHGWLMNDAHVKRGTIQLEDGEEVELDMDDVDEEDERGEYAPVIAELDPELAEQWQLQTQQPLRKTMRGDSRVEQDSGSSDDDEGVEDAGDMHDDRELDEMDDRY